MVTRRDNVLDAMDLKEPKEIPMTELRIDTPHTETLMFPERYWAPEDRPALERIDLLKHNADVRVRCWDRLGFAIVRANVALTPPVGWSAKILSSMEAKTLSEKTGLKYTPGTFVDEWGRGTVYDPRCGRWVHQYGTLTSIEDWNTWAENFPDPFAEGRDASARITIKLAQKRGMAVFGYIRSPFGQLFDAFPIKTYYRLQLEHPNFIRMAVQAYTDYNCDVIKRCGELGCDLVICIGDLAHRDGPYMNPRIFNELYFPEKRRQVEAAHKVGIKYVKHTDGDIRPLLNGLVNIAKVDGIHSLDPSAGVDIGLVKETYGDKIFLMGNVAVDSLALKREEDVILETKECIKKAAHRGGFILGSSNSWYTHCKLRNCLAMVRTGKKYGKYPLQIR